MAKYNLKDKESNLDSSTESLIEISAGDFNDGGDELNSDSSSGSLKEITAGDFNQSYSDSSSESYSDSSSESLKEISAEDFKDVSRNSSRSKVRVNNRQKLNLFWKDHVEIDIKKDEVEKEEIDMLVEENLSDSEKEEVETELSLKDDKSDRKVQNDLEVGENSEEIDEFDKIVRLVLEELESIVEEVEMSFEEACSKLQRCYMNLNQMLSKGHRPLIDKLAKQAFTGTQTLYSAYSSRSSKNMDQNKESLLRVLLDIKNQYSICLTDEQIKEIDVKVHSLASEAVGKSKKDPRISSFTGYNSSGQSLLELPTDSRTIKVNLNPLLNLHEDYGEDSLPSPTHNNTPLLPALKAIGYESQPAPIPAQIMSAVPKDVNENGYKMHPYVIDAFKAVSSYQQKHVKNPSVDFTQLQSPTPSDDGKDDKVDTCSEISSSLVPTSAGIVGPTSASLHTNYYLGISQMTPTMPTGHDIDVGHNSVVKSSESSRDPRLGFMDTEGNSIPQNGKTRKHKAVDDLVLEGHNVKRQRNESTDPKDGQASVGGNKWIEDNCILSHINKINELHENVNGLNGGSRRGSVPSVSSSSVCVASSLSGLKGSSNSTIFMQPVKEQPSLVAMDQENAAVQVVNGSFNMLSATLGIEKKSITNSLIPVQASAMNLQSDTGKSQMKPRDPRQILLDVVQKCKSPVTQPIKSTVSQPPDPPNKKDNLITPRLTEEVQSFALPSQSTITHNSLSNPDIVTDKVSSSPTSTVTQSPELAITKPKTELVDAAKLCADMENLLGGFGEQQKAAIQKERARRITEQNKMFAAHKLCLVLDLDHTLLNSAMFGEIDPPHEELLRKREAQDKKQQERHLYRLPHMGMWTKLRPGVRNFLEKASKLYELHVYTMGNKKYATEMTKILDPQGLLFSGRVISGGDDDENTGGNDRVTKIKDLDGVLGMESSVVIIDDTARVWPHHKLNLIAVERYMYFPSSRRQFGLNGPSLLELNRDERPEYGTLASSLAVIERVHQNFFSHMSMNDVDVRTLLATEQRKILGGCKILFSRVFPLGESNPHLHPLWQTAEQFGAECTNEIDEHVTHVVAISKGTDKVKWALATGRFVVHPGWVEASTLLYRRAKEQDFVVKK